MPSVREDPTPLDSDISKRTIPPPECGHLKPLAGKIDHGAASGGRGPAAGEAGGEGGGEGEGWEKREGDGPMRLQPQAR